VACAKNYETVSTFVKVMQEKLWPLFSGHGVVLATSLVEVGSAGDPRRKWRSQ